LRDKRLARLKGLLLLALCMMVFSLMDRIAFEGLAHPYKENLLHQKETTSITTNPQIEATLASARNE